MRLMLFAMFQGLLYNMYRHASGISLTQEPFALCEEPRTQQPGILHDETDAPLA
jgi:hypothetical protein